MNNMLLCAIGVDQYVAWVCLDSSLCWINRMLTRPAPMPWAHVGRN